MPADEGMTQRCSLPMLSFWASSTVDPNRCFSVVSFSNTVTRGSHQLPVINRNRLGIRTGWSGGCSSAQATMDEQPAPREDHPQSNGSRSSGPPDVQRSKPRWPGSMIVFPFEVVCFRTVSRNWPGLSCPVDLSFLSPFR